MSSIIDIQKFLNDSLEFYNLHSPFIHGLSLGLSFGVVYGLVKSVRGPSLPVEATHSSNSIVNEPFAQLCDGDGEHKLVLLVRTDLKMGKGKIAAQCSHAAVAAYQQSVMRNPDGLARWQSTGQAKVALRVECEQELLTLQKEARKHGLVTSLIRDAGRTQIAPNSKTVLGIGPAPKDIIDKVTGHLKLL